MRNFGKLCAVVVTALSMTGVANSETIRAEGGAAASLSALLPQLIAAQSEQFGHDVRVNVDQTLTRSALNVAVGAVDMAPSPVRAYLAMRKGSGPYAALGEQAIEASGNVRSLFAFRGGHIHPIAFTSSGIASWEDVRGRRVFVGPPAGALAGQSIDVIEAITGMHPDNGDYEAVRLAFSAANQAFEDGRFDLFMRSGTMGSAAIDQFGASSDVVLLGVPDEARASEAWAAFDATPGRATDVLPAGSYENFINGSKEHYLPAYIMMMVVSAELSDDTAYDLTQAVFENIDAFHDTSDGLRTLSLETAFTSLVAPLHPGALRYFEEQGLEIPEHLRP